MEQADAPEACPDDPRARHLEETSRFALAALDQAAALSDFSMSMMALEGPEPILELCLQRVEGLLPFRAVGIMLVDEADSSFRLATASPAEARRELQALADASVERGLFAFALREKRAVLDPPGPGGPKRLLHVLTTASRTRGMFLALVEEPAPELSEVTLTILSILLGNTAQALESCFLHRRIREMNRELEEKLDRLADSEMDLKAVNDNQDRLIRAKTRELQEAMARLEQEVGQRKKAEALLESLNQRLEAKVEVRTRALFRKVAEMEAANQQLKQLERLKSGFLSSVSHELRTPLTSIMGFARLIARDFERYFRPPDGHPSDAKARRLLRNLEIVEKESERLTRLINDVLDLTRIESGKMPWRDEPLSLSEVIADAVMAVEGRIDNRPHVHLRLELPRNLPDAVGDRDRILQVLINLLDNALKFTEEGYVLVEAGMDESGMLLICVEDTGPGVSEEEAEKIFDKFHQHSHKDTLKDKPKGTGLGLAICRHIVARHGGRIWVDPPREGQGSVFCFNLPVHRPGRVPAA
ncbi:Sensor histidine kinase WalK [Fundidesulfovibrio magnetotacticus]|uniref:histidine kinase n=1 Tax=Fundidesulfovibrio magnetotacticus TaxID=2730080 RepID=A0A6V8LTJ0_9BACT|nr:ATP-binding protein [Fundidesulfovibrio magnetotacticus]GFK93409.1 Sensor histidine kinase WalK [Fundidesulfovibrio magnetotacticus]